MSLLELARGPGLALALAVFAAGTTWRLAVILRRPSKPDLSEPRSTATLAGALAGILRRSWHPATLRRRSLAATVFGYMFHLGLATTFLGFAPHIAFVRRLTGLAWPPLPDWVFVAGVACTFVGLLHMLGARLTSPVMRLISGFDDYAAWTVTMLPMVTGMAALGLALGADYPIEPARPGVVALHLLSAELLLAWLPFGKLGHAYLVFFSRAATGAAFARKGATP